MIENYPAIYRDEFGEERTFIQNDGEILRMTVRGIEFQGDDFDSFEPIGNFEDSELALFPFERNAFPAYMIELDMPLPLVIGMDKTQGILHVNFKLRWSDHTDTALKLTLLYENHSFESDGRQGYFDLEMYEIQKQLPSGTYIQTCTNCAFSEYHPAGRGMFTGLACFRNTKEEFRGLKTRKELLTFWDKRTRFVQDTYLCQEFEPQEYLLQR